jgi:hypothetical protein
MLLITTLTPRFNQLSTMCPVPSCTDRSKNSYTIRDKAPSIGIKANKQIHRYGESVLSTWETLFTEYEIRAFHFGKLCERAGKEHPDTLGSMNNLAIVLRRLGKDEQAEEMYRQVLGLMETVLGKEHPSTLGSMINPANVLRKRGKYEQALRLREMVLGEEHSAMVGSMNNLGLSKPSLEPGIVVISPVT